MNRKLKKSIQRALEAPKPDSREKERFLDELPVSYIRTFQFLLIQASYVRKRTLVFSALLLLPAGVGAYNVNPRTLWVASSFIPLLALLAVAESTRSMTYGMEELEMSARFSLKNVVLARMIILGLVDLVIFCCFIPLCKIGSGISFLRTAVYLFVPYLLTANISLWLTRRFREKETVYACVGAAVFVGAANTSLHMAVDVIFRYSGTGWWLLAVLFLAAVMIWEARSVIRETEEFAWNL